jgi:hypothetical protein
MPKVIIDISSSEGNAFNLMTYARRWSKDLDKDGNAILQEMQSGDYANLIRVFEREFGDYCKLINKPEYL